MMYNISVQLSGKAALNTMQVVPKQNSGGWDEGMDVEQPAA
jgi:hypothetical protein